jgi:hypothetical protein
MRTSPPFPWRHPSSSGAPPPSTDSLPPSSPAYSPCSLHRVPTAYLPPRLAFSAGDRALVRGKERWRRRAQRSSLPFFGQRSSGPRRGGAGVEHRRARPPRGGRRAYSQLRRLQIEYRRRPAASSLDRWRGREVEEEDHRRRPPGGGAGEHGGRGDEVIASSRSKLWRWCTRIRRWLQSTAPVCVGSEQGARKLGAAASGP